MRALRHLLWMVTGGAVISADICNVRDFGAKGDGVTLDTASIRRAIETQRCRTVVVPAPGRWALCFVSSASSSSACARSFLPSREPSAAVAGGGRATLCCQRKASAHTPPPTQRLLACFATPTGRAVPVP